MSSKIYTDTPSPHGEWTDEPGKIFFIEPDVALEFAARAVSDGNHRRAGTVNTLLGPSCTDAMIFKIPPEKIISLILSGANKGIEEGGIFAVDIVTFPLYFALVEDIQITDRNSPEIFWKINNNIIHARTSMLTQPLLVISVFHFCEKPIDDAPTHNIILTRTRKDMAELEKQLLKSPLPKKRVSRKDPVMDDRYLLKSRRKQDGQPFSLDMVFIGFQ